MADWDADLYRRFEAERTLPCRDLVHRIDLAAPARIVDLGCGPGNSTAVLRERWPSAGVTGVDSSPEMLRKARASWTSGLWIEADLTRWDPREPFDLVFSNAALQWLPDHPRAVRRIWAWVAPGGALAFQVPARPSPPAGWLRALAAVGARPPWNGQFPADPIEGNVLPLSGYFDLLAPEARRVELWDTEYDHILPGPDAIVEWTKGTGLRPWLDRLSEGSERDHFLAEYARAVAQEYPTRDHGAVVFPFLRRFVIAFGDGGSRPRIPLGDGFGTRG